MDGLKLNKRLIDGFLTLCSWPDQIRSNFNSSQFKQTTWSHCRLLYDLRSYIECFYPGGILR